MVEAFKTPPEPQPRQPTGVQKELDLILAWKEQFEERWTKFENTPEGQKDLETIDSLGLLDIGDSLLPSKIQVLIEKDGKRQEENWIFLTPIQKPEVLGETLPQETCSAINRFASALEVDPNSILEAAIKTAVLRRGLIQHPDQAVFLPEGLEGLKLTRDTIPTAYTPEGKPALWENGFILEYYVCFQTINLSVRKDMKLTNIVIPVRSLLVHVNLRELNFQTLFPQIIFFTTFLAIQKQQETEKE